MFNLKAWACEKKYITKRQFFSRVRWQSEAEDGHGGDQDAGNDEVAEVVEGPPPDLDGEGNVQIGGWTTFIEHLVTLSWDSWNRRQSETKSEENSL